MGTGKRRRSQTSSRNYVTTANGGGCKTSRTALRAPSCVSLLRVAILFWWTIWAERGNRFEVKLAGRPLLSLAFGPSSSWVSKPPKAGERGGPNLYRRRHKLSVALFGVSLQDLLAGLDPETDTALLEDRDVWGGRQKRYRGIVYVSQGSLMKSKQGQDA